MCRARCSGVQRKSLMPISQLELAESDKCARTDANIVSLRPTFQPGAVTSTCLLGAEEAGLLDPHVKGLLPSLVMLQAFAQVLQEVVV